MEPGSRLSARAYIRSRHVQKSSSGCRVSLCSALPRRSRWKAWLWAFTKPGARARPGRRSPSVAGPTSATRPSSTATETPARAPRASRRRSGRRVRLTLVEHRHPDAEGAGVDGLADPAPPAVVDRYPARPARGVEEGVEDRPVGYGVGSVPHSLGLAVGGGDAPGIQVVAPYDYRGGDGPVCDELVEAQPCPLARASPEPADARREPLEADLLSRLLDPAPEARVVGEELEDGVVGRGDVVGVPRERRPPERPLALAEERPYVRGDEAGVGEGPVEAAEPRLCAQVVAVVEDLGPALQHAGHRRAVAGHRGARLAHVALGVALAQPGGLLEGEAGRDVA